MSRLRLDHRIRRPLAVAGVRNDWTKAAMVKYCGTEESTAENQYSGCVNSKTCGDAITDDALETGRRFGNFKQGRARAACE